MTITIEGQVSAPEGVELEVIETWAGVEKNRYRVGRGALIMLTVYGSQTLILREVKSGDLLEQKPGAHRHGELTNAQMLTIVEAALKEEGLQDGDFKAHPNDDDVVASLDRVLVVLKQFLSLDGQPEQAQLYVELQQVERAYSDMLAEYLAAGGAA